MVLKHFFGSLYPFYGKLTLLVQDKSIELEKKEISLDVLSFVDNPVPLGCHQVETFF